MRGYDGSGTNYNHDYDHGYGDDHDHDYDHYCGHEYRCDYDDDYGDDYGDDNNSDDDGMEELRRDGRQQLDTAWNELLQTHGYNPNDTVTDEHWVEYWNSVWHICERKSVLSDHLQAFHHSTDK
jgi:hypothetical protein